MGIRDDLKALVLLQRNELDVVRITGELATLAARRKALQQQIAAAEAEVAQAEKDAEAARAEAKRFELDLRAAEEKVSKYKDQMHSVKTNEQLWALQEEIGHAEQAVGDIETGILEQLEMADALDAEIEQKKGELEAEKERVDAEIAEADRLEAELEAAKAEVEADIERFAAEVPADLKKKYDGIKGLRGGVGVAEALDETCLVCNTKVRPQLYVDTFNLVGVMQCENCKRIIYVAERLGLHETAGPAPEGGESSTAGVPS